MRTGHNRSVSPIERIWVWIVSISIFIITTIGIVCLLGGADVKTIVIGVAILLSEGVIIFGYQKISRYMRRRKHSRK